MKSVCEANSIVPGKLRLIPKGDTFRPIMAFNRIIRKTKNVTMNKKLSDALLMLKNLKAKMLQDNIGYGVFNYQEIMQRYKIFKHKWESIGQPELYFVTMDIEKCYDNVDALEVFKFLTELLEEKYDIVDCLALKCKTN